MILIAIADNDQRNGQALADYTERFLSRKNAACTIHRFCSGVELIRSRTPYDLVLLGAKLSDMDGLEAARFLRIVNRDAMLIFLADMVQLAEQGCGAGSCGLIAPPADQASVERVLDRAWKKLETHKRDYLAIRTRDELIYLPTCSIYYVEVKDHRLVYHTTQGAHRVCGRFREARDRLNSRSFIQCSRSSLVNLRHVQSLHSDHLVVNGIRIQVAKNHYREIMRTLCDYLGEHV